MHKKKNKLAVYHWLTTFDAYEVNHDVYITVINKFATLFFYQLKTVILYNNKIY